MEKAPKLTKADKMNKTNKMIKVNDYEIREILEKIFTSEYEKFFQPENSILSKGVMSYLVKNYVIILVDRTEKEVTEKVYTTYKKSSSQSYGDLYDVVVEAIDFANNPLIEKAKLSTVHVKELLYNDSGSKRNKHITKNQIDDAINVAHVWSMVS